MRLLVVSTLLGLVLSSIATVLFPAYVVSAEIPKHLLEADFKSCKRNCVVWQSNRFCQAYCTCMTEEIPKYFTLEEYTEYTASLIAGHIAKEKYRANSARIARNCAAKVSQ